MTKILLSLHVLAAVLAVGPVTVAASMFPAAVRRAPVAVTVGGGDGVGAGDAGAAHVGTVRLLRRICRVYAGVGISVPVLGFATAASMGVLGDAWIVASVTLTAVAAGLLAAFVLPRQEELLEQLTRPAARRTGPHGPAGHAHRRVQPVVGHRDRPHDRAARLHDRRLKRRSHPGGMHTPA